MALEKCFAKLTRVAAWLAPRLGVNLKKLLRRCPVLLERVFTRVENRWKGI